MRDTSLDDEQERKREREMRTVASSTFIEENVPGRSGESCEVGACVQVQARGSGHQVEFGALYLGRMVVGCPGA